MPTRSPRRNARSRGRSGRTFFPTSGGGGGGGTFDPSTLAGKLLWLRAKDLTLGSTPTTWTDQSGLGHNATISGAPSVDLFLDPPGTATSSSNFTGEPPANAFDGNIASLFDTNSTPTGWIQGQWATGFVATQYHIKRRDSNPTRMPKDFTLQGSNDGTNFTVLDTRTGITWPTTGELKTFTFTNTTSYTYYRLNVTANNGDASFLTVGNLAVTGTPHNAVNLGSGAIAVPSDGGAGTEREIWYVLRAFSSTGSQQFSNLGSVNDPSNYRFTDGKVYCSDYATTKQSFTPTVSVFNPRIMRVSINSAGLFKVDIDNVNQYSATKTLGIQTTAPKIATSWFGQIAEVFARSQVSTAGEITNLISYFNSEHGLTVT